MMMLSVPLSPKPWGDGGEGGGGSRDKPEKNNLVYIMYFPPTLMQLPHTAVGQSRDSTPPPPGEEMAVRKAELPLCGLSPFHIGL